MHVILDGCDKCGFCVLECPVDAIVEEPLTERIVPEACTDCGQCAEVCPLGVVAHRPDAGGAAQRR